MCKQIVFKETGLLWCKQIPKEWEIKRLKYFFEIIIGGVWGEEAKGDDNDLVCIRVADFDFEKLSFKEENLTIRNIKTNEQRNRVLEFGDILIEKSGGGEKTPVGRAILFDKEYNGVCSNFINRLKPVDKNHSRFLGYFLKAMYQNGLTNSFINQTTGIQNLQNENFLSQYIFYPNNDIQQSIVTFLDQKTTDIDLIISQKMKLIDCLKDERAGLITRAVTKGIENDVSTRKANNEWLDAIPEKWSEKKLKFLTTYFKGFAFKSGDFSESGIPIIKATNIKNWQIENVKEFIEIENQKEEFEKVRLKKGDIIISTVGSKPDVVNSAVGQLAIISVEFTNAYLNQNTVCIRPSNEIDESYLKYSMLSNYFRSKLNSECAWIANQAYLEVEDILNISIPIPPTLDEQIEIVDYINTRLQIITQSIFKIEQEIDLIKEYRTSLINEVVTGNITLN